MNGSEILFAYRKRLINVRLENTRLYPKDRAVFMKKAVNMIFLEGYVYHIKDEYFDRAKDDMLMQNKEGGNYRPTYYALRDDSTSLLWMVPMSAKFEKYKKIHDKQVKKYGRCITIVLGEFNDLPSVFLLQNMFPLTPDYLDHIHTKNGNPLPVKYSVQQEILTKMKQVKQIHARGRKIVFTDIDRLQRLMIGGMN